MVRDDSLFSESKCFIKEMSEGIMVQINSKQARQLREISKWAHENGDSISYLTLIDLLQYEKQPITDNEEEINQIIHYLSQKEGITVEIKETDESYSTSLEDEDFIPALVNIISIPQNVSNLMDRLENNEIDLAPVFQRKKDLWDDERQSRLIESLMLRIPIPGFYFDTVREDEWKVIDGLQRLSAFQNYLVGELRNDSGAKKLVKRKFIGLQYLKDFNGKTFDQLPRQYIRRIKEASVTVYGVQKGTPDNVVYNIFQRINTGGLKLEDQEIRNAMYHGRASELAEELAENEAFLAATQYSVPSERMLDQEYVIRFMAFTELDFSTEYNGDVDRYLINTMKKVNEYAEKDLERIRASFVKTMKSCHRILGKKAFRTIGKDGRRGKINKALFEVFSVCFSELNETQIQKIEMQKDSFIKAYVALFEDSSFRSALRSGKRLDCKRRIERGRKLVGEFI